MFQIKVNKPVFIVGPPRTGTTFLYWMLSRDCRFRCPPIWELTSPCPPGKVPDYRKDPRYKETKFNLGMYYCSGPNESGMFNIVHSEFSAHRIKY